MTGSEYIAKFLAGRGVKAIFGITGSVIAPLFDAIEKNKSLRMIYPIHEQAAAMAADAYTRVSKKFGVAVSTSGPGAMNLITGIGCLWFDSIPGLFITGQVQSKFTKGNLPIRQVGFQETDIVSIVKPITKYAVMVTDPKKIRYELEKAIHLATSGKQGPVLIDLPSEIQTGEINENELASYKVREPHATESKSQIRTKAKEFYKDLTRSKRPIVLVGGGVIHAHAEEELRKLLELLRIPVVLTWAAIDIIHEQHPLYRGRIGTYGQRGANITFQNADLLLSLGSRHDGRQTGGRIDSFARAAKRYISDIDANELKYQQVKGHVNIQADMNDIIEVFIEEAKKNKIPSFTWWLDKSLEWKEKYPAVLPEYRKKKGRINGYAFMELLSSILDENDLLVGDCGGNIVQLAQAFKVKKGQRIVTSWAHSPMGYAFAASLGAYLARDKKTKNVVCTIGDGGMQVNLQELQTLKMYDFPIKVFVLNNNSYGIIKQFQDLYLKSNYSGAAPGKGYTVPDFAAVAKSYGLKSEVIKNLSEAPAKIKKVLDYKGPVICNVLIQEDTVLIPRLGWNTGIEDQYPFLDRKEFFSNLLIKPLDSAATESGNQP